MPGQLVIFDFDGTLADTWRDIAAALNRTLDEAGLRAATGPQVRAWVGEGVGPLIEHAVPGHMRSPERVAALVARFREHYDRCCLDTTALYPGIAECVARLSGHTLAILSNKPVRFLERMVTQLGLGGCFAAVVGGDMLSLRKPDPAAVEFVVGATGGRAQGLWMVGDSAIDVATGRAAGAHTVGCAWGLRGAGELRDAGVEFLVEHPCEIPPLIGPAPPRWG
jgi:phosphoglycolate phosphatase